MKHTISVRYPGEFVASFNLETNVDTPVILEQIFGEWNAGSCQECEMFLRSRIRSLSVNDIVTVDGINYQCKSLGWEQVSNDFVNELEEKVLNHPLNSEGSWFALGEIMRGSKLVGEAF